MRNSMAARAASAVLLPALMISGCANMPVNKATQGEVAGIATGSVVGGVIGKQLGGNTGMIIGAVLGGVIGGAIGYEIGRSLDEQDRIALQKRMAVALNSGKDNEPYSWTNPKGNASAKFTAEKSRIESRKATINRPTNLDPTPPLEVIGEPYVAKANAKLYSGPRTTGASVGALKKGQQVVALGRVKGQPWIAVGHDDQVVGYVSETSIIAQADAPPESFNRTLIAAKKPQQQPVVQTASASPLITDSVEASTSCRKVSYAINKDGSEAEKGEFDACKVPGGQWQQQG